MDVVATFRRGVTPGLTKNPAPASAAALIWSAVTIVPAPMNASGNIVASAVRAAIAAGVRKVISSTVNPPAIRARAWTSASAPE